ncbi:AI-2E family transporter [Solitalea lacus]|uniref:AI-2E family transporter n=1 Tax=Solitalea lacus TaxID=2911172 RepID=UPI001EDC0406|nr:AI-2E family transporter [Solitalea lacus]UKJ06799.1 AI-2E family transporter [Solitalea lacus]
MNNELENNSSLEKKVIDLSLKLILILILVAWCAMIILPFITLVLWAVILAITIYPMYKHLLKLLNGKKAFASTAVTIILLCILLIPAILMIGAIVDEAKELKTAFVNKTLVVPPPNPKVAEWPLVGKEIYKAWSSLSTNLESAIVTYHDQILEVGQKIVGAMRSVFSNIMMFTFSIIIAGIFLAYSDESEKSTNAFAKRLVGSKGDEFNKLVIQTIRNVSKGILGVAFIQFVIMGACFMLAGVPLAGLWAILVFLIALIQLPGAIVAIPVIIYIYSVKEPVPATIWAIIILLCGLSDNVLKPLLMGKGAPVPMIVIFLGAIGGFMLSGFIGLFTGAVVLSLGYKLSGIWINYDSPQPTAKKE